MLAEVGHGTAMPSAPPEVRAAARYVAPPLDDDGAARMIEDLVLASPQDILANADRLERASQAAAGGDPMMDVAR